MVTEYTPPLHPARSLHTHTPPSRRSLQIVPVTLSDIGQGIIKVVTVKEWLIELRATANSDEDTEHISFADAKAALRAVWKQCL